MSTGDTHGLPADRPGASGLGAKVAPAPPVQHTGPREVEFEEVLAWGSGDGRVVDRRAWKSDFVLRLATGVAAAGAVVFVALGAANQTSSPAGDTAGVRHAGVGPETQGLMGRTLLPSCLVAWPDQRHLSCPLSLPKALSSELDCYYPNQVCPPVQSKLPIAPRSDN
jgi:hypothetical protein